jgi:hypothetical protein
VNNVTIFLFGFLADVLFQLLDPVLTLFPANDVSACV